MKYDFNTKILDLDDKEIPLNINNPKGEKVTLKSIAVNALLYESQSPMVKKDVGIDKVKKGRLALRIHKSKVPIDLTVKETSDLIELIKECHRALIVVRALDILDPESK